MSTNEIDATRQNETSENSVLMVEYEQWRYYRSDGDDGNLGRLPFKGMIRVTIAAND